MTIIVSFRNLTDIMSCKMQSNTQMSQHRQVIRPIILLPQYIHPSAVGPHQPRHQTPLQALIEPHRVTRTQCVQCRGHGRYQNAGYRWCSGCAGTGRNMKEDLYAGWCDKCKGSKSEAYLETITCDFCCGAGYIEY